jgi:hypothetical protein
MNLFNLATSLRGLVFLPSEVLEFGLPHEATLARRVAGTGGWRWAPLSLQTILQIDISAEDPFWIIFTDAETVDEVLTWARRQSFRPLVVSATAQSGVLARSDLTFGKVRKHVAKTLEKVIRREPNIDHKLVTECLSAWHPRKVAPSDFPDYGHNVVTPNVMALEGAGCKFEQNGPFAGEMDQNKYISIIVQSARAVLEKRSAIPFADAFRKSPPGPDIIITAPSFYLAFQTSPSVRAEAPDPVRVLMRMFQRQDDYFVRSKGPVLADVLRSDDAMMLLRLRTHEQRIHTLAIGLKGASSLAATIRLPASVNRGTGALRHLATHLRQGTRNELKMRRLFSAVQDHYRKVVAKDLLDLIQTSMTGIKLVTDAPLEWLPVGDLPLSLRFDVSRICSTPGNLMIGELVTPNLLKRSYKAYQEVLIISAFQDGDPIAEVLNDAVDARAALWSGKVQLTRMKVRTETEFVEALNSFRGGVMIFDGHGFAGTADEPGGLLIGGKPVDVWSLRGKARMPPVVILSACDTLAVDASHASAANGFLAIGARTVLGTLLPLDARAAASFIARLLHRLADYLPSAIETFGRAIRWTEIISGMLRMQLLTDLLNPFVDDHSISVKQMRKIHASGNAAINLLDPEWFEDLINAVAVETGIDIRDVRTRFRNAIATSEAIRYVQLGSPESVILDDQARLDGDRPAQVIDRGVTYVLSSDASERLSG